MCSFSNSSPKKRRKAEKTREKYFHFSALIAYAMHVATARAKLSAAYIHGQMVDTKLTNQSARFTQVVQL